MKVHEKLAGKNHTTIFLRSLGRLERCVWWCILASLQGCKTHCKVIITLDNAADQHYMFHTETRQ